MKKSFSLLLLFLFVFILSACTGAVAIKEVIIVYTNDIHSYIANTKTDDAGTELPALRLDDISSYVKNLKLNHKNVLLVDSGDEIQGTVYGAYDKGKSVIDIMNSVGYDLATPGNHDFDYGMDNFNSVLKQANFPYISCNFKRVDGSNVLDKYKIFEIGGFKIGFVGISTPQTITQSTPTFFQNENKEFIYKFEGQSNKEDLYKAVQDTINEIRNNVDYVIALGHLGVGADAKKDGIRSIDVINNTTGIDAFIDGHSHTVMEKEIVKSKDNKDVILTQTGSYLENFGVMTLTNNDMKPRVDTKLLNELGEDKNIEYKLISDVNAKLRQKFAVLEKTLYVTNANNVKQRLVRARETNLGDFSSDSVYWYLNLEKELDCDIALTNGGGIRANIDAGDVTYLSAKTVMPFGNQVCLVKTKGINIKNALEMGVNVCEGWNKEWDSPAENGGFLQVAGLKFDVDASVESSVKVDSNNLFSEVSGEYRVRNIMIYNKKTDQFEALDENKEYTVGGINYILRNSGCGLSMFADSQLVVDYIDEDYMVLAKYMMAFKNGNDIIVNNANCPLKAYSNYSFDYENPLGSGRINILNLKENN